MIEVDTFCMGCHYNLHGQVVSIDERLGFPVCRCPECGKFHPAGTGVTASAIWVRRFATLLLFVWIAIVLAAVIGIGGIAAGLDIASVGVYTEYFDATPDGQPVEFVPSSAAVPGGGVAGYVSGGGAPGGGANFIKGTHTIAPQVRSFAKLRPWYVDPKNNYDSGPVAMVLLSAGSLVLGFIAAMACVSFLWHWPRRRYGWALIIAIVPAGLSMIPFGTADEFQFARLDCLLHVLSQASLQMLGMLAGILLGRPLARQIARTIIPPKPRQALAFLWSVDGKKPPAASSQR